MIQVAISEQQQTIIIPRAVGIPNNGAWLLTLTDSLTYTPHQFSSISVVVSGDVIKVTGTFNLTEIGQYDYLLTKGNKVISLGLALVGEYGIQRVQYQEQIEIVQYNG